MRIANLLIAGSMIVVCAGATAAWKLDNDASELNFISTKNEHISELHQFGSLQGTLSDQGQLEVQVKLDSVQTNIPIRNERMQEHLFNVTQFPMASLTASLPEEIINLSEGQSVKLDLNTKIRIKGSENSQIIGLLVSKNSDGSFVATTTQPVIINSADYALDDGVTKLKEIAMLNSISMTVPVSFSVVFKPE